LSEPPLTPDIFDELMSLLNSVPIINGHLTRGDIDTKFPVYEEHAATLPILGLQGDEVSFRDIINKFTELLQRQRWRNLINESILNQLRTIGCTYPIEYLLFDYCLAALDNDHLNARQYLDHATNILNLSKQFHLLLDVIVSQPLTNEKNVRGFLAQFAATIEPPSAKHYTSEERYGNEFRKRYEVYIKELKKSSYK
jgi:hypothetical protein